MKEIRGVIEDGIIEAVMLLRSCGVETVMSCSGHEHVTTILTINGVRMPPERKMPWIDMFPPFSVIEEEISNFPRLTFGEERCAIKGKRLRPIDELGVIEGREEMLMFARFIFEKIESA